MFVLLMILIFEIIKIFLCEIVIFLKFGEIEIFGFLLWWCFFFVCVGRKVVLVGVVENVVSSFLVVKFF